MPILIRLVAAWISGLLFAAHALSNPASTGNAVKVAESCFAVLGLLALGAATAKRVSWHTAALVLITFSALVFGEAAARRRIMCIRALANHSTLLFESSERASPGRRLRGAAFPVLTEPTLSGAGCKVGASLHVVSGSAPPGAQVRVVGPFQVTQRGLMAQSEVVATGNTGWLLSWRGNVGERVDTLFKDNAPMVRALVIADQDGISPDLRDLFADAGLVHLLSISGLHVAIIAGSLLIVASSLRIAEPWASAFAFAVVAIYIAMLGAPASALRSGSMLGCLFLSEKLQRPVHPWTALALGAAIPTFKPEVVTQLGYQLSVGGMAALLAARAVLRRLRQAPRRRGPGTIVMRLRTRMQEAGKWQWHVIAEAITGVIATAVTAPLIAWTFGRVSIIAPLSNIVAAPVIAFIQPALFLALLLSPIPGVASFFADATGPPLTLLQEIARLSASVPGASLRMAPTLLGACCAGVASAAFVRASASRNMTPGLLVAASSLAIGIWSPLLTNGSGEMELHMIDVGQGDALAIRTPRGRWILVDAGRSWQGGDAGRRVVIPYVQRRGGRVMAFVLSHAHEDHVGGASSVVQSLHPARWLEPAFVTSSSGYRKALTALKKDGSAWSRVRVREAISLDGVTVRVLAPDSAWTAAQINANETSVVLRVEYRNVAFLLTGDAEASEESWMIAHTDSALLAADVLKLGHHGSRTSTTSAFLDAVHPRLALISVGEANRYGHPSPITLTALAERHIPALRTDNDGSVVISTNGRDITAHVRGESWTIPRREAIY